jgi:hypothetical protein
LCKPCELWSRQARGKKQLPAEDGTGTCAMLKLKDWPPDSDFHRELVRHNQVPSPAFPVQSFVPCSGCLE